MKIMNARDKKMNDQISGQPDLSWAVDGWFESIFFVHVQTQLIDGFAQDILVPIKTLGQIVPMSQEQVNAKPEGMRHWRWLTIHCLNDLCLKANDKIMVDDVNYRVKGIWDYTRNGFRIYECGEDFTT